MSDFCAWVKRRYVFRTAFFSFLKETYKHMNSSIKFSRQQNLTLCVNQTSIVPGIKFINPRVSRHNTYKQDCQKPSFWHYDTIIKRGIITWCSCQMKFSSSPDLPTTFTASLQSLSAFHLLCAVHLLRKPLARQTLFERKHHASITGYSIFALIFLLLTYF